MDHGTLHDIGSRNPSWRPPYTGFNGTVHQLTMRVHKGLYFIIYTTGTVNAKTQGGNGPLLRGVDIGCSLLHSNTQVPDSHVTILGICHSRNST